jgi:hypothetical protein
VKLFVLLIGASLSAQSVPRFEDHPAAARWKGPSATPKLVTPSQRMFRTSLTNAAKEAPDFAGHYKFASWGCGSVCAAGAIIDLVTGTIYSPPGGGRGSGAEQWIFSGGFVDGAYASYRVDSRLVIVREQARDPASQDLHFYVWESSGFRKLLSVTEKKH